MTLAPTAESGSNGVSQPLVSQWEVGQQKPSRDQIARLQSILGGIAERAIRAAVIVEQIRSLNKSIAELEKTIGEEGSKLEGHKGLSSIRSANACPAARVFSEFHPGKGMPEETIKEILKALTERFRKATSGNFLPKVSFVKTSFRLGGDSEHVSDWATARTLLRAVAEHPRAALKNRAYFFRGLKVSEKDLLTAMNVAEDHLVARSFQADSLEIAIVELEVLEQIDESERSDLDKAN